MGGRKSGSEEEWEGGSLGVVLDTKVEAYIGTCVWLPSVAAGSHQRYWPKYLYEKVQRYGYIYLKHHNK